MLAGGLLPHALMPAVPAVRMYAFSYHPPPGPGGRAAVSLDPFDPALFSETTIEGCDGVLQLRLYSTW